MQSAIGQYTKNEYLESDILTPRYGAMSSEPLRLKDTKEQVIAVRRHGAPHFRRIAPNAYRHRIRDRAEPDPRHNHCIDFLLRRLNDERGHFTICTPTFDDDGTRDPDGQTFVRSAKTGRYRWWSDSKGTRIPVGLGRYIQPDLCGQPVEPKNFHAHSSAPNVIIEVIQSHYPEKATMLELLRLSEKNHLVVFIFMGERHYGSRYSRIETDEDAFKMNLRPVIVLLGGNSVQNGVPYKSVPRLYSHDEDPEKMDYDSWYDTYERETLMKAMRER